MKRTKLIRELVAAGCVLVRHGGKHDIYRNPTTGRKQLIPRHSEIDDRLAQHIKRYLGLEDPPIQNVTATDKTVLRLD